MKDTNLEESLKKVLNSIHDNLTKDIHIPFNVEEIDFKTIAPDSFHYAYIYEATRKQISVYERVIAKKTNQTFASIFVNYTDLEWELSQFFRKEFGGALCTDRAAHVLSYCLKRSLGIKASLRKDFAFLSESRWFHFVKNHPFTGRGKISSFTEASNKLLESLKDRQRESLRDDSCTLAEFFELELYINGEKRTVGELAKLSNPSNAVAWLKHLRPDLF